jgi:hypothetical protein
MSRQDHSAWREVWYEAELARLQSLEQHPQGKTWSHPADLLIAVLFVVVLTCLFLGVIA